MIAIKGLEMPTDCKKCPLMGTDGIDKFSPIMCIAIWATKREIKHCVEGKILDGCPLVEIVTCKDCKYLSATHSCNASRDRRICPADFYCANAERRVMANDR